jgi:hypothetical protein
MQFTLTPTKPGNINDCFNCAIETEIAIVAKVAYPSKNSSLVEIELTQDHAAANAFNGAQRRSGVGPLRSIVASREPASKAKSGAEGGALYYSNLGEKRTVKF